MPFGAATPPTPSPCPPPPPRSPPHQPAPPPTPLPGPLSPLSPPPCPKTSHGRLSLPTHRTPTLTTAAAASLPTVQNPPSTPTPRVCHPLIAGSVRRARMPMQLSAASSAPSLNARPVRPPRLSAAHASDPSFDLQAPYRPNPTLTLFPGAPKLTKGRGRRYPRRTGPPQALLPPTIPSSPPSLSRAPSRHWLRRLSPPRPAYLSTTCQARTLQHPNKNMQAMPLRAYAIVRTGFSTRLALTMRAAQSSCWLPLGCQILARSI